MEAVLTDKIDDLESGTVIDCLQKGYTYEQLKSMLITARGTMEEMRRNKRTGSGEKRKKRERERECGKLPF